MLSSVGSEKVTSTKVENEVEEIKSIPKPVMPEEPIKPEVVNKPLTIDDLLKSSNQPKENIVVETKIEEPKNKMSDLLTSNNEKAIVYEDKVPEKKTDISDDQFFDDFFDD